MENFIYSAVIRFILILHLFVETSHFFYGKFILHELFQCHHAIETHVNILKEQDIYHMPKHHKFFEV